MICAPTFIELGAQIHWPCQYKIHLFDFLIVVLLGLFCDQFWLITDGMIDDNSFKNALKIDPKGIQVIKNFNNQKDVLIFPENWKSKFLEFTEEEIFYKKTQVVEFI